MKQATKRDTAASPRSRAVARSFSKVGMARRRRPIFAATPPLHPRNGALSGTPKSSLALRQGERSQRGRWRSRIANIPNRRNELTDLHDIQATKASSLGLPGVTGDKFGGVTLSCSCNMQ